MIWCALGRLHSSDRSVHDLHDLPGRADIFPILYDAAHAAEWAYVSWVGLVLHLRRSCSLTPAGEEPDHPDCDLSDLPKLDDLAHDLSHLSGELDDLHHDLSHLSEV